MDNYIDYDDGSNFLMFKKFVDDAFFETACKYGKNFTYDSIYNFLCGGITDGITRKNGARSNLEFYSSYSDLDGFVSDDFYEIYYMLIEYAINSFNKNCFNKKVTLRDRKRAMSGNCGKIDYNNKSEVINFVALMALYDVNRCFDVLYNNRALHASLVIFLIKERYLEKNGINYLDCYSNIEYGCKFDKVVKRFSIKELIRFFNKEYLSKSRDYFVSDEGRITKIGRDGYTRIK